MDGGRSIGGAKEEKKGPHQHKCFKKGQVVKRAYDRGLGDNGW